MKHTDQMLVSAMLRGDEAAFAGFFKSHFPSVYRFALPRLGGDVEACKEVVQLTLVKAVRNLAGFRGESALFSWLCQICRHQIVDYLRMHNRHTDRIARIHADEQLHAAIAAIEAPAADQPLRRCEIEERCRLVQSVLVGLPAHYADVLRWKYMEERGVAEIGELLGVGHVAAQSILARARICFRDALATTFGSAAKDILRHA